MERCCICCRKTWDKCGPEYRYALCEDCYMNTAYTGKCQHKEGTTMVQCACGAKHCSRDDEYDHWQTCKENPRIILVRLKNAVELLQSEIQSLEKVLGR